MSLWVSRIKVRHIIDEDIDLDDVDAVRALGAKLADAIESHACMFSFNASMFRNIPDGDDEFGPADYFNRKLDRLYDFCDFNRIWIDF